MREACIISIFRLAVISGKGPNYGIHETHTNYLTKAGILGFTGEAMDLIQSTGGNIFLVVVAIGPICYGIFMFLQAKCRNVESVF